MEKRKLSRRDFLRLSAAAATGAIVVACAPAAPQIIEVEKEVPVKEVVVQTVEVEKEVVKEVPVEKPPLFPKPVKLEFWTDCWGPPCVASMRTILDRFKEDNPNFSYELSVSTDEKFVPAMAAGVPPDISILCWNMDIAKYAPEKGVLCLDPYIEASGFDLSTQLPVGVEECRWLDGKLYGMAWGTDVTGFMWNKDLFKEEGLDTEVPPKTWEELAEFSDKLTKKEDGRLIQVGYMPDYGFGAYQQCHCFGGRLYNEDYTKLTLNTPEMVRALEYMKSYYDRYSADNLDRLKATFGGWGPNTGFYSGKIVMAQQGEWIPRFAEQFEVKWNYGIAPIQAPADKPELYGTTPVWGTALVIPTDSKHPDVAWELMMFLLGPWATAVRMSDEGNVPTNVANLEDPRFTENPGLYPFMKLAFAENAYSPPLAPLVIEMFDELGRVQELILHDKMGIQEGMTEIEKKLQPELDKALQSL